MRKNKDGPLLLDAPARVNDGYGRCPAIGNGQQRAEGNAS
jgi:hypothetical protein